MDRAPVSVALLLAAATAFAAEPPAATPDTDTDADSTIVPLAIELAAAPDDSAPATPAAALSESTASSPSADTALAAADAKDTAPSADATPTEVPTVEIKKVIDDTVCRRERPTGSLISTTRCYSRSASTLSNDEQMRRDLEEMRMRQNDQQAREAAAAMARRRGGL
jgi:hypothetical protein